MNNNKFYKIGVAVSVLLIGVIVACIVIAQKQDDKVAKAEDFPSVSSSTNVVENEVNVAEQTNFEEIAKVEENKNTENDSKNVTTKNNKTENTTGDKSAQNTTSKKSNASYMAINKALEDVKTKDTGEVPMHIRNAPIEKMKELGYHEGYLYPHDFPGHYVEQQYLPDKMVGTKYYVKDEK